jgi:hypothetical protein
VASQCGDVNGDGIANVVDALKIARGELLEQDTGYRRCDVTRDGSCAVDDALKLARGEIGPSPEDQICPAYVELCRTPICGDGVCERDETGCSCFPDCGIPGQGCPLCLASCGDGRCEPACTAAERHENCPEDCPCPG